MERPQEKDMSTRCLHDALPFPSIRIICKIPKLLRTNLRKKRRNIYNRIRNNEQKKDKGTDIVVIIWKVRSLIHPCRLSFLRRLAKSKYISWNRKRNRLQSSRSNGRKRRRRMGSGSRAGRRCRKRRKRSRITN